MFEVDDAERLVEQAAVYGRIQETIGTPFRALERRLKDRTFKILKASPSTFEWATKRRRRS